MRSPFFSFFLISPSLCRCGPRQPCRTGAARRAPRHNASLSRIVSPRHEALRDARHAVHFSAEVSRRLPPPLPVPVTGGRGGRTLTLPPAVWRAARPPGAHVVVKESETEARVPRTGPPSTRCIRRGGGFQRRTHTNTCTHTRRAWWRRGRTGAETPVRREDRLPFQTDGAAGAPTGSPCR